jgi:hypothetical protein
MNMAKYTPKAQRKTVFGKIFGVRKKKEAISATRHQNRKAKVAKRTNTPTEGASSNNADQGSTC